jgi:hypothetical protein
MEPGLCGHCVHCQLVDGARTRFYLCRLSASDPRFPRYPVLPVRACAGHRDGEPSRPAPPGGGP